MHMTTAQQRVLERYWKWHTEGMTLQRLTALYSGRWLLFLGVIGLTAFIANDSPLPAGMVGGFFLGQVIRDLREIRHAVEFWPLLNHIIDWDVAAEVNAGEE